MSMNQQTQIVSVLFDVNESETQAVTGRSIIVRFLDIYALSVADRWRRLSRENRAESEAAFCAKKSNQLTYRGEAYDALCDILSRGGLGNSGHPPGTFN
jgi:hypothetical protein